jgi:hypothetical protein
MKPAPAIACVTALLLLITPRATRAAVGCTLNDPDRDVLRLFPEATNYRTEFITIKERGGASLRSKVESRLGDSLDATFEADDVPYAYYTVLKGETVIGRIHGVNQKGMFGGMQLILATDPAGIIVAFYYQKLTSPDARRFRDKAFTDPFVGLSLADFTTYGSTPGESRIGRIADPSKRSSPDFRATLRGLHKNLILLDLFFGEMIRGQNKTQAKETQDEKN